MSSKFFEFSQNNSGGSFDVNDKVCHRMFIEADSCDEANDKAEDLGCYWNGCEDGMDCSCCGDRWDKAWRDDDYTDFPLKYSKETIFQTVEEYSQYLADNYCWTSPDVRIFYKDGTVKEFFGKKQR